MARYNLVALSIILIAVCFAQDVRIQARPSRPEKFENQEQVTDYIMQLKKFLDGATPRYGKRFSLPAHGNHKSEKTHGDFHKFYKIYKYYDDFI